MCHAAVLCFTLLLSKSNFPIISRHSMLIKDTSDYIGKRQGNRVVSLGERPYFDPASKSRREALGVAQ